MIAECLEIAVLNVCIIKYKDKKDLDKKVNENFDS